MDRRVGLIVAISNNKFRRLAFTKGGNGWNGENLTAGYFEDSLYGGSPFGSGEYGGLAHFKGREDTNVGHND